VFFLVKIAATDGISVQQMVAGMVGMSPQDYRDMMMQGGRPIEGNRSRREWGL
jgi:protocatechuate 4,5-dioxygenase alpha chain